jgi:uncharacterized protein YjbI with pentapeptide repeats
MEQEETGAANQSWLRGLFTSLQKTARSNWMTVTVFAVFTLLFFSVIGIAVLGYIYTWKWTGVVGKTFWDWLKLMIVPVVLGAGGYSVVRAFAWSDQLGQQQRTQEAMREAQNTSRQASLDQISLAYIDRMETWLVDREMPLYRSQAGDAIQTLARARTLNVLEALDSRRRGSIVRFLYEARLISIERPIIQLSGANLTGSQLANSILQSVHLSRADLENANLTRASLVQANLSRADLREADLSWADLRGTDLSRAYLREANLSRAELRGANLSEADLRRANLIEAYLREANLSRAGLGEANLSRANLSGANLGEADLRYAFLDGANLRDAHLSRADLRRANLIEADLGEADLGEADLSGAEGITNEELEQQTASLAGAIMPNGQKYEDWLVQ